MNGWWILAVIFYPVAAIISLQYGLHRSRILIALVCALVVALVLWLGALPRDLAWALGPINIGPRFAVPLTAYLIGLPIAALLMVWAMKRDAA